jgi:Mg-chelatase subunit ChlI
MAPLLKILTSTLAVAGSVAALPISNQPTRYDLMVRDITAVDTSTAVGTTTVDIPANLTMSNTTISNSTTSFLNGKKSDEAKQKATQMKEADDHRKAEEKKKQDEEDRKLQEGLKRLEEQKKQEEMKKEEERKQEEAKKAEEKKKADAEKFRKDQEKALDAKKKDTWAFSGFVGAWTFVAGLVKTLVSAIPGLGNI